MATFTTSDIRNVALVGHAGSGKTTLTEALLHKAGALHHVGVVEKGSTASDFTEEEKARGHSIYSAIVHANYQGKHINIIDTPGYPDFVGQALQSLPAVETAIVVINAIAGVESNARRMMERAKELGLARMIVINRIDAENLDLPACVNAIREAFGNECLPINVPSADRKSIIDCFANSTGECELGSIEEYHKKILEQVVEVDEELMVSYLETGKIDDPARLHRAFEKALEEGHLIPVCFVASRPHLDPDKPIGVEELLDVIVKHAPNPLEGHHLTFVKGEATIAVQPDPAKPFLGHTFQVSVDPFVGKLSAFRVQQGTVKTTTSVFVSDPKHGQSKKPFKVGHLFRFQGKEHLEIPEAIAGDIVAVAKVDEVHRDCVLYELPDEAGILCKAAPMPEPMYGLAITAKKRGDEGKIGEALHKIIEEDPTFKVVRDASTHETVVYGLGELHLRVILQKMKERFHVDVDTKPPKIAYRETISAKADGHHRHKKQTGGAGQFGEVYLRVVPLERGSGFEFVDDTFGGNPPKQYLPAVEKGVRMVLEGGAVAGYPLQDIRVEIYDGKHHDVDSKEIAFITAGKRAFIDAIQKAKPVVLEPIVKLEVTVPQQFMGDITGDLSGKRGRIQGTDMLGGDMAIVKALVPLSEVSNYQNQLKSVTGGQGSFAMELSHYDPVPFNIQAQIVAAYKPKAEED